MPDETPPLDPDPNGERSVQHTGQHLTHEQIEEVLAHFRTWLTELIPEQAVEDTSPDVEPFNMASIVAQFTALRHDVNLQTKAVRLATENSAEALKQLAANQTTQKTTASANSDEATRPLLKALVDIADSLGVSLKQISRARESAETLLQQMTEAKIDDPPPIPEPGTKPGLFARLGGAVPAAEVPTELKNWIREASAALTAHASKSSSLKQSLQPLVAGLSDGYAMSLRRVEKALSTFGLEVIGCLGNPFDPEIMEVVEAVADTGQVSGTVVEEVRRGYRWKGSVFRFAQVKVAR